MTVKVTGIELKHLLLAPPREGARVSVMVEGDLLATGIVSATGLCSNGVRIYVEPDKEAPPKP